MLSLTQFDRMVLSKWRGPASQALQEALKNGLKIIYYRAVSCFASIRTAHRYSEI